MKKNETIKTLQLFTQLEPSDHTLDRIHARVMRRTERGFPRRLSTLSRLFQMIFSPMYALPVMAITLFIVGRQMMMPNHFLVLSSTLNESEVSLQQANSLQLLIQQESQLDTIQENISQLNLRGEILKYSREQCHESYIRYEQYLQTYENQLRARTGENRESDLEVQRILDKIELYKEESEKKWPSTFTN